MCVRAEQPAASRCETGHARRWKLPACLEEAYDVVGRVSPPLLPTAKCPTKEHALFLPPIQALPPRFGVEAVSRSALQLGDRAVQMELVKGEHNTGYSRSSKTLVPQTLAPLEFRMVSTSARQMLATASGVHHLAEWDSC